MYLPRKEWTIKNAPFAIAAAKGTGIFPETLLAMAIVESQGKVNGSWFPGAGLVARKANNFFGIKKGVGWKGKTIDLPTPGDAPTYQEQIIAIARAGYAEAPNYATVITQVANSVKKNIENLIAPIQNNGKVIGLIIAATIVTLYVFKNKMIHA
jgi:flagellum-specific peptidoglycan hydrolase FlgJ